MRYWWVNQNQTFKHEVEGGFLWSPKVKKNGSRNHFYDTMEQVRPADLVLSFCDTQIKAVGTVQTAAVTSSKPAFGKVGDQWDDDGWLVAVDFQVADHPIRPKDHIGELAPYLAAKYAPLQPNGNGNQGVYLAEVSEEFAQIILRKMNIPFPDQHGTSSDDAEDMDDAEQRAVLGRTDIGETQKQQLVMARRGQGIFKNNVRLNEARCRITGVSDLRFLIASHIKPWSKCTDDEKLDGCNGLLLSPHADRLFDRGYISFGDDGELLKSQQLSTDVLTSWGIDSVGNVGAFNDRQSVYLEVHRKTVFRM